MIRFKCPTCDKPLGVKDHLAGKRVACPKCKAALTIPVGQPGTDGDGTTARPAERAEETPSAQTPVPPSEAPTNGPASASQTTPPFKSASRIVPIHCPECKERLRVPIELSGQRRPCPKCKKAITIPDLRKAQSPNGTKEQAAAPSTEAVEDLAADLFAGPPPAEEETKEQKKIEFTCPWCDEEIVLNAEAGGKREPCPSCKRILKVPELKEDKPKDWREIEKRGPALALHNQPEELQDAWGTDVRSKASRSSLEEAGVITEPKEPVSVARWIKRGFIAVAVVGFIVLAYILVRNAQLDGRQNKFLRLAQASFEETEKKSSAGQRALFYYGVGEFYAREEKKPGEALDSLRKARFQFPVKPNSKSAPKLDEELLLVDIAKMQVRLGGDEPKVIAETHMEWPDVQKDLGRTLQGIYSEDAKALALRQVSLNLMKEDKHAFALGLATEANAQEGAGRSLLLAEQAAILLALDKSEQALKLLQEPMPENKMAMEVLEQISNTKGVDLITRLAFAEGYAYQGKYDLARDVIKLNSPARSTTSLPMARFIAELAVAEIAHHQGKVDEAKKSLAEAKSLVDDELKNTRISSLLMYQTARLTTHLESPEQAKSLLERIGNKGCKARAELEILKKQAEQQNEPLDISKFSDKKSLAYFMGILESTRRGSNIGRQSELLGKIDDMDENLRPFSYLGMALGVQDSRR